jgi:small conductance mechanosensitive channel
VVLQLRAWSTTSRFWDTRWDLTEGGKKALEAAGITVPFPQQVVHWASDSAPPPVQPPVQPPPSPSGSEAA